MADEQTSSREVERWRRRYYDQLQEFEDKEQRWSEVERVLRQCASRLAVAVEPTDDTVAAMLHRLRSDLRDEDYDPAELERLVQELTDRLSAAEPGGSISEASANGALLDLLDGLSLPRELKRDSDALRRRIASGDGQEPTALAREVAALVTDALKRSAGGRKGSGLFKGLIGGGGGDDAREILHRLVEDLLPPAGMEQEGALLSRRLEGADDPAALKAVADELAALIRDRLGGAVGEGAAVPDGDESIPINELLIRLLERLQIPSDLSDDVAAMKQSLRDGLDLGAVEPFLARIADLVARIRSAAQREKQEIEDFLQDITASLKELDQAFQAREDSRRESLQDGRDLDQAVNDQVRGLEDSMEKAGDFQDLRATIQERVHTIRQHMESFRQVEEERAQRAEEEAQRMAERLREAEHEADGLRERIVTERQQAFFDPLTGIHNRLAYDQRIDHEYKRWRRYNTPLVLMMWDVDRFKEVNDTYGHQAGDKVLRVIAKLLGKRVRETDFVARYGGEEFVILLPETDLEHAQDVAEKLRSSVENADFNYRGQRVLITISCGIAAFHEGDDQDSVFRRADSALYRAKEAGRNRCCVEDRGEE